MNVVKPESHRFCFACGEMDSNPNSLNLQFIAESENSVKTTVTLGEMYQGYSDVLHGGIISTLLDAAMTHCLFFRNIEAMTVDLNVRFVKPVPINEELTVGAEFSSARRGIFQLTSFISFDGDILARGCAKFLSAK